MIEKQLYSIKNAARSLSQLKDRHIVQILSTLADRLVVNKELILLANQKDLDQMDAKDPKYDRLLLTDSRIEEMAAALVSVSRLPSPLGKELSTKELPNGLLVKKIAVPLGVVGVIYEARPNVTTDVFSLCLKAGNACVLKGGSDAYNSNVALLKEIKGALKECQIDSEIIQLLPPDREAAIELMNAVDVVDVLIPRGSQALINSVREQSKVPVIETGAGIVHTYFDLSGDVDKGKAIVFNAKTRRVSVCNALDCLLIHRDRLQDLLPLVEQLAEKKVIIYADQPSYAMLIGNYPDELLARALPEHYGTEFLDYKMAIKTVKDLPEALDHIYHYSSRHSEAIIAEDESVAQAFITQVDAAAVYTNTSTAFTDGGQFGLGAEIGISTQKLHARGPMALEELTSYKWVIKGNGQVRAT
jgi:glutamate-5-semialdehyde dehydrogenase